MRIILFIIVLLCIPFALYRCATKEGGIVDSISSKKDELTAKANPQQNTPQDTPPTDTLAVTKIDTTEKIESRTYQFQMREAPAAEALAMLANDIRATVDPLTQTVAITGPTESVINSMIYLREIDKPSQSCAVSCWIVFVDKRKSNGFDFAATFADLLKLSVPNNLGASIGNGSLIFSSTSNNIEATLGLVADGTNVEVIQRPQVMLTNGTPATIESLSEVPIPNNTISNGFSQTNIEFRKVGLALNVTPTFLGQDRIRLAITQNNGLIGSFVEINGSSAPVIESQLVQSTIELQLGQSILLGGVETSRKRNTVGILKKNTETITGLLYVIIATHPNYPKAYAVQEAPEQSTPPPGLTLPDPDLNMWEILLPAK